MTAKLPLILGRFSEGVEEASPELEDPPLEELPPDEEEDESPPPGTTAGGASPAPVTVTEPPLIFSE